MTTLLRGRPLVTRLDAYLEERDRGRDRRERWLLLPVALFILINAVAYSLVDAGRPTWQHLYAPLVWLVLFLVAHLLLSHFRAGRDPFILPVVALLSGWGLLLIDRLAPNFLGRQTLWLVLSVAAGLALAILPRTLVRLQRYRYTLLLAGMLLLLATLLFGVNPSGGGPALWLPVPLPFIGPVYFQPSELLKPLLVIFFAGYFAERIPLRLGSKGVAAPVSERHRLFRNLPFLGPLLLMGGFSVVLLVWQRDLGAATQFFILFLAMLYLATGRAAYIGIGLLILLVAGILGYFAFSGLVALRVNAWLNPWPDASDQAYQIVQSLYALGSGGILGQGIGQGFPDYIPVVHSDFAFAAIAEEWGLIGGITVVAAFALLAQRALRTASLATNPARPRPFHTYLAAGIAVVFTVQALLIMGGVSKLLPLTGVTLPFVSYGGSSLMVSMLMIGLLLFLSADAGRSA